jgi:chromosome segregation ATPase
MQLVVAQVAAAVAVASEVSTWMTLEAAKQSVEDRTTAAQSITTTAVTERDALASMLALAEAEVEKLRAAATSTEEAAERARAAAATTEAAAQDATQDAACEKAVLETKVVDLERDLGTAMVDLATVGHQFSQVSNKLQEVSEEVTRLRESNAKLLEDLEGESSRCFHLPFHSLFDSRCVVTCFLSFQGCACIAPE